MEHGKRLFSSECCRWLVAGGVWLLALATIGQADTPNSGWQTNFEVAAKTAAEHKKPILATVTAVWCGACRQMQQLTLNDAEVSRLATEKFVCVAIDGDQRADLVSKFGIAAFPTTFVIDTQGEIRHRWIGFQASGSFLSDLRTLAAQTSTSQGADEFPAVSALFPSNSSRFGFGAFCLVSLLDDNQLRRGVDSYVADYRGVTLCFHSPAHRDRFFANPDRYWPVANGNCLVTSREQQQSEPGDPRVGVLWKNRLWFFADRDRQRRFMAAPDRFSNGL